MDFTANFQLSRFHTNRTKYQVKCRVPFSNSTDYIYEILELDPNRLIVSGSNGYVNVYDKATLRSTSKICCTDSQITKLLPAGPNTNTVLVSTRSGEVSLYDLRDPSQKAQKWFDPYGISSFDFNDNTLVAGTFFDQDDFECKLNFWDIRNGGLVQCFTDSHSDDITNVKFHPIERTKLLSSGMDGLISIFNLNDGEEDDALEQTFNIGASINQAGFFSNENHIFVSTHMETFSLWTDQGDLMHNFGCIKQTPGNDFQLDYVIGGQYFPNNQQFYLTTGSFEGSIGLFNLLSPEQLNFEYSMKDGHTNVVRSCFWDRSNNALFSGGEDGNLLYWSDQIQVAPIQNGNGIGKFPSNHQPKSKPYRPYRY